MGLAVCFFIMFLKETIMAEYWFTFGLGQKHENRYCVIEAKDYVEASAKMFKLFGAQWFTGYTSAEKAGVEKYGLTRIY